MERMTLHQVAYVRCKKGVCKDGQCSDGCIRCGACIKACPYDAITLPEDSCAIIDGKKCRNCGRCKEVCPRGVIADRILEMPFMVACSNKQAGAIARKVCETSCIGCGNCVRNCPSNAIRLIDHVAEIDQNKCLSCGFCVNKCPRKCIVDFRRLIVRV